MVIPLRPRAGEEDRRGSWWVEFWDARGGLRHSGKDFWVSGSMCELRAQGGSHGCKLLLAMGAAYTLKVNDGSQGGQNKTEGVGRGVRKKTRKDNGPKKMMEAMGLEFRDRDMA